MLQNTELLAEGSTAVELYTKCSPVARDKTLRICECWGSHCDLKVLNSLQYTTAGCIRYFSSPSYYFTLLFEDAQFAPHTNKFYNFQ